MIPFSFRPLSLSDYHRFFLGFGGERTFLQSVHYGTLRETMGEENFRFGIFAQFPNSEELVGIVQFQKIKAKRSIFFHTPHGPLIKDEFLESALPFFLEQYKILGKQKKCDFVRISPLFRIERLYATGQERKNEFFVKDAFLKAGFRDAPVHLVNPERTWVLDITRKSEEILANMRKSTRYEVRQIEKSGIFVRQGNSPQDLEIFWKLHEETVKRHGFVPFSRSMTEQELRIFGDDAIIFSAGLYNEQKFYSSSLILFDDRSAYYHQGASVPHKLPFSYATLWRAVLEAQKRGCKEFNFWGVCQEFEKSHPWYGLSYFKRGFGGEERVYLHAQDFPLTIKYYLSSAVETFRKWKRGYGRKTKEKI